MTAQQVILDGPLKASGATGAERGAEVIFDTPHAVEVYAVQERTQSRIVLRHLRTERKA